MDENKDKAPEENPPNTEADVSMPNAAPLEDTDSSDQLTLSAQDAPADPSATANTEDRSHQPELVRTAEVTPTASAPRVNPGSAEQSTELESTTTPPQQPEQQKQEEEQQEQQEQQQQQQQQQQPAEQPPFADDSATTTTMSASEHSTQEPGPVEQKSDVDVVMAEAHPSGMQDAPSEVKEQTPPSSAATEEKSTPQPPQSQPRPQPQPPKTAESVPSTTALLSAPASWQIPPSVLQAKSEASSSTEPVNKASLKKERLEARIAESKYDVAAWDSLINEIQQSGDLAATRQVFERALEVFPTSPKYWLSYLELELKYSNFNEVEALFTRCLKPVLSVDLWKYYLGYIRRINQGENGSVALPESRSIIERAYEYVLNNVGIDKEAGSIWADYIHFLKSAETTNTWEEQRKMDSMRRAYQQAVAIPLNNVEHLWREYDQWEIKLNRLTAKKFLGENSAAYMTARTALREMRVFLDNIPRATVSTPPQWTEREVEQLVAWKNYIAWEKNNPLQLEDTKQLDNRISYAYHQAFLSLRFYPELWYDYASYYLEKEQQEKALAILKEGLEVIPDSLLLTLQYTELCESRRQLDEARQAFDSLLDTLEKKMNKHKEAAKAEVERIQKEAEEERANLNLSDDIDGELREQLRVRERQVKKAQDEVEAHTNEQIDEVARASALVWVNYMAFARRTEGIVAARGIFSRARRAANHTHHIFTASALMEYHNSKDAVVAGRIFSVGLKMFPNDPNYVSQYLDFLIERNDDNNTRALFERTLATMPSDMAEGIWQKFLEYETKYGDLNSIQNVSKRRNEAYPNIGLLDSFLQRHTYLDLHPIIERDLGGESTQQQKLALQRKTTAGASTSTPSAGLSRTRPSKSDGPSKKPLLETVDGERYPRPDLKQWQQYKPVETQPPPTAAPPPPPPTAQGPPSSAPETMTPPGSGPPPAVVPTSSAPAWQGSPSGAGGAPPLAQSMQPQPAAPAAPRPGPPPYMNALPEPVAYFMSQLPPAHTFNGPIIQVNELMDLLRNVIIPMPGGGAGPKSGPMPPPPQRGGGGRGRGAPRPKGGPGRPGGKRRARDFDDDFSPAGGGGMGPNQPPAFDMYRARQNKRHR
ncbi:hypothetical protein BCR43DRAFT_494490 [Syncephalastrum racemosum]|uniref:Suppressor of forked domain-containing protein n=1 Tax=Syncephalastrum racemosum TaxID=13706 RepID=A0A1X2H872_SYNRA|nr:hypothetical protein BCR43DRAFT_494490 [Syncephalastrum racemosum]